MVVHVPHSHSLPHHPSEGAGEKCSHAEYVVKKYYLLSVLVVIVNLLAIPVVFFTGSSYGSNTLLQALLLYILLIFVHELAHYIVAKRRSPAVRLRPLLRHGVIVVDYVRLGYKDFMRVASAPLIIVQLPITLLYLVLSHPLLLALALLHALSSLGDVFNMVYIRIFHKGAELHMVYSEKGAVVGFIAEERDKCRAVFYEVWD
jgi:hypothetical protein